MIKTKQELLNHFSDINEMYNNPFMYQTLSNMIDELLEQQSSYNSVKSELKPCEDAISREDAIRIAEQGQIQGYEWQFKKLCNLPSVTPKAKWIPVSERLPEIDEEVLVFARCYFECSCYEECIVKVRDACPEFCNGTNDNQLLDFGCKHGTCGNCEMENTGNDDKMFFTHMVVANLDKDGWWDSMDLSDDDIVIAWMPLPQPYKEVEAND